jgi:acylphosphatase
MKVRIHVFISGKVQGVFFRSSIRRMALSLNVLGWTKNLKDGRVEAVFEGDKREVNKMIEFCRKGPRGSRVTELDIKEEQSSDTLDEFRIYYN